VEEKKTSAEKHKAAGNYTVPGIPTIIITF